MKITVHLNRIKIPYEQDFNKVAEYFKKHNVEITFTFKTVSVSGYKSTYSSYLSRWLLLGTEKLITLDTNTDVNMFVFDQNEWATTGKYPLRADTPNGCAYLVNDKPYITIGAYKDCDWVQIAHEIMHALRMIANIKGFYCPDVMDTYRDNSNPDSPIGNFTEQWNLLKPYLEPTPIVTLTRTRDNGIQTIGALTYKNFSCKTLERTWKNNKINISCIPKDVYHCKYSFSPKFMKYTYEVEKIKGRSGIRIHSGNFFFDIQGCILLGDSYSDINKDGQIDVLNSRNTIKKFEELLGKRDFVLIIK